MIVLSSATYDSGGTDKAYAAAADADGNVYITGTSGNDYLSQKYTKALSLTAAQQLYTNGRPSNNALGIALDGLGNVIVSGEELNASLTNLNFLVLKYSSLNAAFISSATYDGGGNDSAATVKTDSQNNILVTGYTNDSGNKNVYTIKYSPELNKLSTAAYDGGNTDQGAALAVDHSDNIIMAGFTQPTPAGTYNFLTVKYDNNLKKLYEASFDSAGGDEKASGVALDGNDNIIVTGRQSDGVTQNFLTLRYDTFLNLLSSAVYDSGFDDIPTGVAVDSENDVIVTGYSNNNFFAIRYDSGFSVISTAAYEGGSADRSNAVAVDADNNVIVTGQSYTATDNYFTIKYNASPKLTEVSPLYIGETANVILKGKGFLADSSVSFQDLEISTGAISLASGQLTLSVTPSSTVILGITTVTIANANGESYTSSALAYTKLRQTVAASQAATINAMTKAGQVTVDLPSASFPYQETITIYTAPVSPGDLRQVGEALYYSVANSSQPVVNTSIKLRYTAAALGTYSSGLLSLAYWDDVLGWVGVTSSVNASEKSVTGLSKTVNVKYAIVKQAEGSGGGGGGGGGGGAGGSGIPAKVYPNPYRPGSAGSFGQSALGEGIVFAGLEANQSFKLTIVDLAGQLVFQKSGTADGSGNYLWDTKTVSGGKAATGVYLYFIKAGGEPKKGKFSVIR